MFTRRQFLGGVLSSALVSSLIPFRDTSLGSSVNGKDKYAITMDKMKGLVHYYNSSVPEIGKPHRYEYFTEKDKEQHTRNVDDLFSFLNENFDPSMATSKDVERIFDPNFKRNQISEFDESSLREMNEGATAILVTREILYHNKVRFDIRDVPSWDIHAENYKKLVLI